MRKILVFASVVEFGTGLALIADPAIVVQLLLGADLPGAGMVAGRCFGIALVCLALACWPGRRDSEIVGGAFRAMLIYNASIALYLAALATAGRMKGALSWPAAALHGVVASALVWTARRSLSRR